MKKLFKVFAVMVFVSVFNGVVLAGDVVGVFSNKNSANDKIKIFVPNDNNLNFAMFWYEDTNTNKKYEAQIPRKEAIQFIKTYDDMKYSERKEYMPEFMSKYPVKDNIRCITQATQDSEMSLKAESSKRDFMSSYGKIGGQSGQKDTMNSFQDKFGTKESTDE